jgi:uncharacterized protein (DUF427 family)
MNRRKIQIQEIASGRLLASAETSNGVQMFEGAWYFKPTAVDMTYLVITERTYTCPYKGVCAWIDLAAPDHQAENVAFTYFDVKEGYEFIRNKIAFYAGRRPATMEVSPG